VDKSEAEILVVRFLCDIFTVILLRQMKTEAGSAGEQPVRDKFELLTKKSKKRIV
jgi:hypothetical protein